MFDEYFKKLDRKALKQKRKKKAERKISERVFDNPTLATLSKLHGKSAFDTIEQIVSTGKEANVYYGLRDGQGVAVKIYCYETSDFKNMGRYVRGDPRFPDWKGRRHLVQLWAQKEYKNLMRVCEKVDCPQPIHFLNNVLVMDFIGEDAIPAPKLRESTLEDPKKYFDTVIKFIKEMYELRLVHGDLSEYNILDCGKPVFIDFSTGVLLDHPEAHDFLKRDIQNIVKFFGKYGITRDAEKIYGEIVGDD